MPLLTRLTQSIKHDAQRAWDAGAGFIAIARWSERFVGIARRIILARILGAENIGHIAIVNVVMSLIRLPAGAGTFPVVNKLVAEHTGDENSQKRVIGTSLRINIVASAVMIGVVWCILTYTDLINDPVAKTLLYILSVFVPVIILTGVLRCGLMGQRRMKTLAVLDSLVFIVDFIVVIPLAILWALRGWMINYVIAIFFGFALFAWFLRPILSFRWNSGIAKRIGAIGGFSFLSQLMGVLIIQFDTLTVSGILRDPAATGIYNTAALVVQHLMVIPGSILVVVFPFVAQNRNDMTRLTNRYRELRVKLFLMTLAISAVAWIICPWFFPIFGREFSASTAPFRVLIFGLIARSLYVLDNTYLEALGRTDVLFVGVLISALIVICLNIILIPRFGLMGAAWATTSSMFLGLFIRQVAVRYFIFYKKAIR
jgi:O-antigen/teichoic acid export membrane protein